MEDLKIIFKDIVECLKCGHNWIADIDCLDGAGTIPVKLGVESSESSHTPGVSSNANLKKTGSVYLNRNLIQA